MNPRQLRRFPVTLGLLLLGASACSEGGADPAAQAPPRAGDWCAELSLDFPGASAAATASGRFDFRVEGRTVTEVELPAELPLL